MTFFASFVFFANFVVDPSPVTARVDFARPFNDNQWMDVLTLIAVLVAWFVLQTWVLPRFGVPT